MGHSSNVNPDEQAGHRDAQRIALTGFDPALPSLHECEQSLLPLANTAFGVSQGFAWGSGSFVAIKCRKRNRFQRERKRRSESSEP